MRALICLAMLCCFGAQAANAQWRHRRDEAPVEFGVRGGYDFGSDVGSAGAQVRVPLMRQLLVVPSADVFFGDQPGDSGPQWQLNADAVVAPDEFGGVYFGAGAAFADRDFNDDGDSEFEAGYNLLVGIDARSVFDTRARPFAEARWTGVDDYHPFRLVAGVNVPIN
jgi:hypothetical protein